MSNKTYDALKFLAQILLPFGTMVAAIILALKSDLPADQVVIAIATAADTFLGVLLAVSSRIYHNQGGEKDAE